jgi:hypothetical protein
MWLRHPSTGQPVREAFECLEYSKDNYWNRESMVEQTVRAVLPTFGYASPGCRGVWAFDNATNHNLCYRCSYCFSNALGPWRPDPTSNERVLITRGDYHTQWSSQIIIRISVFVVNRKGLKLSYESEDYGLQVVEGQFQVFG